MASRSGRRLAPLWVTGATWTEAAELLIGDQIVSLAGDPGTVEAVSTRTESAVMYDLTVAEVHSFFVGDGGWWVHNCDVIPRVSSPKLQNYVDDLYKGVNNPNRVGSGTTMDAVRYERATGLPVGRTFHTQKAEESLRGLQKWLRNNPGADLRDRALAQDLIDELIDALK